MRWVMKIILRCFEHNNRMDEKELTKTIYIAGGLGEEERQENKEK